MERDNLIRRIDVASGRTPADLVVKNGKIIDVFNGEIMYGDIAIVDGYFAGIGEYTGKAFFDAKGKYVSPAFIDSHVHIESSMITPLEFAKVLLLHGVTTVIADPHEIANVSGTEGIQYMLDSSENLPFDVYFMLPSCVPATDFEHSGAVLTIKELLPFYQHPRVLGLAEVMNFPAVLSGKATILDKIIETRLLGKKIDGHAAGFSSTNLNVYMSADIRTDHESTTPEEAKERLKRGMYLMIREGTVAKNFHQLIEVVTETNARRCIFVTDDKHLDDLMDEGSIDHHIRLAISSGIRPITAFQMGSINSAECFGLKEKGAIAPGYKADFLIVDDLEAVSISHVFKDGKPVVENGRLIPFPEKSPFPATDRLTNSVHIPCLTKADLQIPLTNDQANIIEIIPNSLITRHTVAKVEVNEQGLFQTSIEHDQLKLAVIERHHLTGHIGLGIVKGFGLKTGAIATTVAHDSHNLIIAGTNDDDLLTAVKEIQHMQGGLVVVNKGRKIASLELPIAGLLSDQPYSEVSAKLKKLRQSLDSLGASRSFNPFLTLSFLSLPVIPELKLTDMGLFQVSSFQHIPVESLN